MRKYKDCELLNKDWIIEKVQNESIAQISKWKVQICTPFEWLTYTMEELGELAEAISEYEYREGNKDDIVEEAIQVATLALKIAEIYELLD